MHVVHSWNKAHKGAFSGLRVALSRALFSGAGDQSMQQSPTLLANGTFVGFVPTASHMRLMHLVFACLADCPRWQSKASTYLALYILNRELSWLQNQIQHLKISLKQFFREFSTREYVWPNFWHLWTKIVCTYLGPLRLPAASKALNAFSEMVQCDLYFFTAQSAARPVNHNW